MATAEVEKRRNHLAALSFVAVVVVLGIPMWLRTTTTYRAWLPMAQIQELAELQLLLSTDVEVVFARGTLTPEQQKKIPVMHSRDEAHTIDETDLSMHTLSESPCGSLVVYVIPQSSPLLPQDVDVYVGQRRMALLRVDANMKAGKSLHQVLAALEPQVKEVLQVMSFSHDDITAALSDRVRLSPGSSQSKADSMRTFKSSPGYEITFSLLNPDPKWHNVYWDMEGAVRTYVQPLLSKLNPVANFSVDSQTLHYTMLGVNSRFDANHSAYTLSADSLAHVINPVEARLGSNAASSNPVLNFLLYVPDAQHSPLHILDNQKQKVTSNAFHSPRWGGIMVYNVYGYYGSDEIAFDININMVKVMGVFLSQLR
ncbi:GPI transamidase component PIG-S [Vanacampus margaritifer]